MTIRMLRSLWVAGLTSDLFEGETYEVPDALGESLVAAGNAVRVSEPKKKGKPAEVGEGEV